MAVIANFHRRRVVPLMERALPIFKMTESADPAALARSRMLEDPLPVAFAAMRARRMVEMRKMKCSDNDLWSFKMRPEEGYFPVVSICSLLLRLQLDSISAACSHRRLNYRTYPASTTRSPPRPSLMLPIASGSNSRRRGRTRRRRRRGGDRSGGRRTGRSSSGGRRMAALPRHPRRTHQSQRTVASATSRSLGRKGRRRLRRQR